MEVKIKNGEIEFKGKTLDDQIAEKKAMGLLNQGMPPVPPPGYLKRKSGLIVMPTHADKNYEEQKIEWDKGSEKRMDEWLKIIYNDKYSEIIDLWNSQNWQISKGAFFDKYESIKYHMGKGVISKKHFIDLVLMNFKNLADVEFIHTPEADEFLNMLFHYFIRSSDSNDKFEDSRLFVRKLKFGTEIVEFSVHGKKGLGIVGGVGIGKTKIIKSFCWVLSDMNRMVQNNNGIEYRLEHYRDDLIRPCYYSGNDIEEIFNMKDKYSPDGQKAQTRYKKLISQQDVIIDDVLSEDKSFGRESVRTIFQIRYELGLRTHMIVNYPKDNHTIEATLDKIAERYDFRVDDRQFEMFNFVALTEKSKRISKYL